MTITLSSEELREYEERVKLWADSRTTYMLRKLDDANGNKPLQYTGIFTRVSMVDWDNKNPLPKLF